MDHVLHALILLVMHSIRYMFIWLDKYQITPFNDLKHKFYHTLNASRIVFKDM